MSSQICSEIKWPLVGTFRTGENFARHWTEILDFFILFVCEWMWVLSWVNIEQFLKEKKEKTLCAKLLNPLLLTDMSRERKEICCSYNISFQAQKQFRWNWDSFSREYAMKMLSALQLYGDTVGQIPPKCKETSNLMWLSLIWCILVLFVCWNLFCTIANLRIKCVTETKNVSVLFAKS